MTVVFVQATASVFLKSNCKQCNLHMSQRRHFQFQDLQNIFLPPKLYKL